MGFNFSDVEQMSPQQHSVWQFQQMRYHSFGQITVSGNNKSPIGSPVIVQTIKLEHPRLFEAVCGLANSQIMMLHISSTLQYI